MARTGIKQVLIQFLKDNKASIIGYLVLSLAGPLSSVYLPYLYGQLVSLINDTKGINREVKIRFVCILILWIIVQICWSAKNMIDSKFEPKLRSQVRQYVVSQIMDIYREDYSEEELGGLLAELVRLPDVVDHIFSNIRNHILPITFVLIFSIGYFTWTNPLLGGVSVFATSIYIAVALKYSTSCSESATNMNKSHSELHEQISDTLGNLLNIYTANQDNNEIERLNRLEEQFVEHQSISIRCSGRFRLLFNLSYVVLFCSINVLSFYLFSQGVVKISDVVSVLIVSLQLISKMSNFIGSIDRFLREISVIKHVEQSLDKLYASHRVSNIDRAIYREPVDFRGSILIRNLGINYGDKPVIEGFNAKIPYKSTTVLVGKIGTGKTSIINSIIRLVPYSGTIKINGYDISEVDLGILREQVIYIPQNPRLFNRTIYENIVYGSNLPREQVERIMDLYGITIDLDRRVGKFGQSLSGGQRQIVYLLRCLIRNAPIILMDEPTASLDRKTKSIIMKLLTDLLRDRTVVIVTHDKAILKYATKVIKMH